MQNIALWIQFCITRICRQPSDNCFCMRAAQTCAVCTSSITAFSEFRRNISSFAVRILSWIVRDRLHSSAALAAASRGTPMRRLASTARPIWAISSSYGGTASDEATICGDNSWLTTLITTHQWLQCDAGKSCGLNGFRTTHQDLWLESGAAIPIQLWCPDIIFIREASYQAIRTILIVT